MTAPDSSARAAIAPSAMTGRSIAPDLARGAMLLLIAIANAPWYLWAAETRNLSSHPVDASALDRLMQTISLIAVDGRTYPMFAFLFGYGIWQLYSRQLAGGTSHREARRLLRRRHWWMLAFGGIHASLLWMGDVVGAYGMAGLVLVWIFLDRRDAVIRAWVIVLGSLLALLSAAAVIATVLLGPFMLDGSGSDIVAVLGNAQASIATPNYLESVVLRLVIWLIGTPLQGLIGLTVPAAILLAILAARHRVLEEPRAHLPLLRRVAIIGIGTGWTVGALAAAQNANLLGLGASADLAFSGVLSLSGLMCGVGYVALFGLIAARIEQRGSSGRVATALQAVGKRSLTFYLAQSVMFAPIMSGWGLGLGAQLSSWSIALAALIVWLITVAVAVQLERRGVRGPAEWLLRRLAYPRRPLRPLRPLRPRRPLPERVRS